MQDTTQCILLVRKIGGPLRDAEAGSGGAAGAVGEPGPERLLDSLDVRHHHAGRSRAATLGFHVLQRRQEFTRQPAERPAHTMRDGDHRIQCATFAVLGRPDESGDVFVQATPVDDMIKTRHHFVRAGLFPCGMLDLAGDAAVKDAARLDQRRRDQPDVIQMVVPAGMLAKCPQEKAGRIGHRLPIFIQKKSGKIVHAECAG